MVCFVVDGVLAGLIRVPQSTSCVSLICEVCVLCLSAAFLWELLVLSLFTRGTAHPFYRLVSSPNRSFAP